MTRSPALVLFLFTVALLGVGLAGCPDSDLKNPSWTGAFTNAISTCAGSHVSFPLDPPRAALIESRGEFRMGRGVELIYDGCSYFGEIAEGGRLYAEMDAGCPASARAGCALSIQNVFSGRTTVYTWADYVDPDVCDVEARGEFERD